MKKLEFQPLELVVVYNFSVSHHAQYFLFF